MDLAEILFVDFPQYILTVVWNLGHFYPIKRKYSKFSISSLMKKELLAFIYIFWNKILIDNKQNIIFYRWGGPFSKTKSKLKNSKIKICSSAGNQIQTTCMEKCHQLYSIIFLRFSNDKSERMVQLIQCSNT